MFLQFRAFNIAPTVTCAVMCHHIDTAIDWDAVAAEEQADDLETERSESLETAEEPELADIASEEPMTPPADD